MSMLYSLSSDESEIQITMGRHFDGSCERAFRDIINNDLFENIRCYKIDLKNTVLINKTAFALLYLLYEHAGGSHSEISLHNCSEEIFGAFSYSTMNSLMKIQSA